MKRPIPDAEQCEVRGCSREWFTAVVAEVPGSGQGLTIRLCRRHVCLARGAISMEVLKPASEEVPS